MGMGFIIEEGVLLKYDGIEPIVDIPDGVEKIGEGAFCDN